MAYTMYTPLNVWLDPASVTDVVAYIQNYLSENTIYSEEEIEELIHDYLEAHPELIGGVQSVNGKTGTVVLSASDINTQNNVTIESVLASLSSQISSIASSVATNTSNITNLKSSLTGLDNNRIYIDSKNDLAIGNTNGSIGDTISIGSQTYWAHIEKNVFEGEKYEFVINRTTTNLAYYCYFTDSNNKIISRDIAGDTSDDWHITNTVIVPSGASKMFISMFASLENAKTCFQLYKIITNVQYQLDTVIDNEYHLIEITDKITNGSVSGDTGNAPSIGTQTYWVHALVSVNDCSSIKFITNSTGTNASWYVYFVDSSNKIVQRCVVPNTSDDWLIEHYLDVPGQAENVYIVAFSNISNANAHMKIYKRYSKTTNQRVYEIENNLFGDGLPNYYHTANWLENKIDEINELSAIKNGAVFAFFTDVHLPSNAKNSRYLLRTILSKTTVPLVICGGDIVGAYGTEADVKEQAHEWIEYCADIDWDKILQIQGNHDYTIKTSASENTGWTATDKAIYNYVMRKQEARVFCPSGKRYWYYDLPGNLRIIGFCGYERTNSGDVPYGVEVYQEKAEYDWLMNVAMPANGYKFIVITHASPDRSGNIPASGGAACLYAMLNAMNNKTTFSQLDGSGEYTISGDYTGATSEVICVISGHNHRDASDDSNGVLYITTTSDACYNNDPNTVRTRGTVTEQAIDVFCIDTDARTVKTVRVGGGVDRNWSY